MLGVVTDFYLCATSKASELGKAMDANVKTESTHEPRTIGLDRLANPAWSRANANQYVQSFCALRHKCYNTAA